jgi:hypothetical protein
MAPLVYALCALTAFVCSLLLARGYSRSRDRLLLWSALCFAGLGLNNVLVFVDVVLVPDSDLSIVRKLPVLLGLAALVYGLVWEVE